MKYQHIFGPVLSRRLGVSLGVDLVYHKVCTLDCVYCECGKTTYLTRERKPYVRFDAIKKELDHYFEHHEDPDYITFSGSGEPTLNSDMGRVIDHIKSCRPQVQVAILTNATLLDDSRTCQDLMNADLVVPSLDAVSARTFARINRPCPGLTPTSLSRGIEAFSRIYSGSLYLEIFILPQINDTPEELAGLRDAISQIQPHMVQLNTLDRPGTVPGITPASQASLKKIQAFLSQDQPSPVEIIARAKSRPLQAPDLDIRPAVLETIHRRPCTLEDLTATLGADPKDLVSLLNDLATSGKIEKIQETRGVFYRTVK